MLSSLTLVDRIAEAHTRIRPHVGAAAVAIAGLMRAGESIHGKNVVVVLCGRNIAPHRLAAILQERHEPDKSAG